MWSFFRIFRFFFEGIVGGSIGDIVIDDVRIYDGRCVVLGMNIEILDGIWKY